MTTVNTGNARTYGSVREGGGTTANTYAYRIGRNFSTGGLYTPPPVGVSNNFRHGGDQVNFSFFDGHAETRKYEASNYGGFGRILDINR